MVLTSPSRISTLVEHDIDRLGQTPRKAHHQKLELTLPAILEVIEEPASSPIHTSTPSTDLSTLSSFVHKFMLTLVTHPTMTPDMSTSPRHSRLNAIISHDIDNISAISPSLATSPIRTRSPSRVKTPSLPMIREQQEDMNLLTQLSLELEHVIQQQQQHQSLTSPLSCRYVPMGSPHKLRQPLSASSHATPDLSPNSSPLMSHRSLMIM